MADVLYTLTTRTNHADAKMASAITAIAEIMVRIIPSSGLIHRTNETGVTVIIDDPKWNLTVGIGNTDGVNFVGFRLHKMYDVS